MKYRLKDESERVHEVRLRRGYKPDGIAMQIENDKGSWVTICTLTEDGMLALWDINKKVLTEVGLDMRGDTGQLNHNGHISVRIA